MANELRVAQLTVERRTTRLTDLRVTQLAQAKAAAQTSAIAAIILGCNKCARSAEHKDYARHVIMFSTILMSIVELKIIARVFAKIQWFKDFDSHAL